MKDVDRELAALAAGQRNVFSWAQAADAGLSAQNIHYRTSSGLFVPRGPHTFTFAGTSLDWRGELFAGLLDLGPQALITGRSAAALLKFDGFEEGPLDFVVPRPLRARKTIGHVASTPKIGNIDRTTVDGLAVTSGTFTVLMLLGLVSPSELGNAIDSAIRSGLTSPTFMRRRLLELGPKGRLGVKAFNDLMDAEGVQSWLERQFLKLIKRSGLPRPAVQRVYRRGGTHVARVDFDFDPAPVVVEVGGKRGYLSAQDRRRQEHRRNELQLLGKTVYFFTSEDVTDDAAYVLRTVRDGLGLAS